MFGIKALIPRIILQHAGTAIGEDIIARFGHDKVQIHIATAVFGIFVGFDRIEVPDHDNRTALGFDAFCGRRVEFFQSQSATAVRGILVCDHRFPALKAHNAVAENDKIVGLRKGRRKQGGGKEERRIYFFHNNTFISK